MIARPKFTVIAFLSWMVIGISPTANAAAKTMACKPVESATFVGRVSVQCSQAVDGKILFFAAPTTDPKFAARVLSIFEAAQLGDRWVKIYYDPDDITTGPTFSCAASDCRNVIAATLTNVVPDKCEINSLQPGCSGHCAGNLNNTNTDCPGWCPSHNYSDPRCGQDFNNTYCPLHSNDVRCPEFATTYCPSHPDDVRCANYCENHHNAPGCHCTFNVHTHIWVCD